MPYFVNKESPLRSDVEFSRQSYTKSDYASILPNIVISIIYKPSLKFILKIPSFDNFRLKKSGIQKNNYFEHGTISRKMGS